jgi:hypothetical protein
MVYRSGEDWRPSEKAMSYSYRSLYSAEERSSLFVDARFRVVTALLSSHEPSDEDFGLLAVVVLDAANTADADVLDQLPELFRCLRDFDVDHLRWSDRWSGRIDGLEVAYGFAICLRLASSDQELDPH